MALAGHHIRQDKSYNLLTDAILARDQARTTDLFYRMVKRDGRSVGDALGVVTAAEAPFVQVPSHINFRYGHITLVNNDHTILGLRASVNLAPFVPDEYRLLPFLQSVWYIPAGLDIWNQLLGRYPGRYATMKGMQVPPPAYGPAVWNQEQEPITPEGTAEEKLHEHLVATASGDARRSYGLFLGLASDPSMRPLLRDQLLFLGLIDLQDTILRTTVARQFTDGQHPFDYCNTANYWLRRTESPYQPRLLYLMANFVNDSARSNKLFRSVMEEERGSFDGAGRSSEALLTELGE